MAKKKRKTKRKLSPYNRHVQREMKAGKSMKQAAASWKGGGVRKRVKRKVAARRKTVAARKRKSPKVGRKVGSGFNQQKIFKLARVAALLGPHAAVWMSSATPQVKATESVKMLSGFDMNTGQFDMQALIRGYGPVLATTAVTAVIPKINGLIKGIL